MQHNDDIQTCGHCFHPFFSFLVELGVITHYQVNNLISIFMCQEYHASCTGRYTNY